MTAQPAGGAQGPTMKPAITPTLVLGLGGTGTDVLRFFKRRLRDAWSIPETEEAPAIIQMLSVDTVPWTNLPGQEYLHQHEYAFIGGYNATQILRHLENHPSIASWWRWDPKDVPLGQIHSGARQTRCVGRLSLFRRYRAFWNRLEPKLSRMVSVAAIEEAENLGHPVVREGGIRHIYVVSSVCGGTGAGVFLDVAHKLRATFKEQAVITAILVMPSVFMEELDSDLQRSRIQANAYAALKELDHFQSGHDFEVQYPGEGTTVATRPFDRIYLIGRRNTVGEALDSVDDVKEMIGHQIFLETVSHIGSRIWAYDVNITQERFEGGHSLLAYGSFATSSLLVPEQRMLEYSTLKYAQRLLSESVLRPMESQDENEIEARLAGRINYLQETLRGGPRPPAGALLGDAEEADDIDDEIWDEYEDEEELLEEAETAAQPPASSTPRRDWNYETYEGMLNEIRLELYGEARQRGLRGALTYLERLHRATHLKEEGTRADVASTAARIEDLEARRDSLQVPFALRLLDFWPFNTLFVNNVKEGIRLERLALSNEVGRLRNHLQQTNIEKDLWIRLNPMLETLRQDVALRVRDTEAALDKGIEDAIRTFFQAGARPDVEWVYDLNSDLVDDHYIADVFEPETWRRLLRPHVERSLDKLIGDAVLFHLELGTAEHRRANEAVYTSVIKLSKGLPAEPDVQIRWFDIADHILAHARTDVVAGAIPPQEFHLSRIVAADRQIVQQRIKQMFSRCHPFWRFDLDRGGFDEEDMEQIVLVGVDDPLRSQRLYDELFRDFSDYERVATGDPKRIDACEIQHGLPLSFLEEMGPMYRHYVDFLERGPIHLDPEWRSFPEIALPGDVAASEAIAAPRAQGRRSRRASYDA